MTLVVGERKCNTTLSFSYCLSSASWKQHLMDSLTGAVRLSQEIRGALRSPHRGQKSWLECKGKRRPDRTLHSKGS